MGNFLYDKSQGDIAEQLVLKTLQKEFPKKKFAIVKGKNSDYDIVEETKSHNRLTVEVKFDIKAKTTGNICFEFTNGEKPTGICVSQAKEIWYVIRSDDGGYEAIVFDRVKLLQHLLYLSQTKIVKVVVGGDQRRFGLMLIPLEKILEMQLGKSIKLENING